MTIIVFLMDTSASMNQRIFLGGRPSLLDVAKSAVEYFVKVRQRSPESRGDRYMLLSFEEPPNNIRAGWKENLSTFMSELKNLHAITLTTLGTALRHTFDVLNVNRMQHGIDTYGQGRCPFYLEPSIIVVITDGGRLCSSSGVSDEVKLMGTSPGAELTREPFRWDQRLFGLVLKMNGQPSNERETGLVPTDDSPIEAMCEATGGRSYAITTHRMLHQCIESIAQKVVAGVVLHFEKWGPDPVLHEGEEEDTKWHSTRRMIHVPRSAQKSGFAGGCWPIPESFFPEPSLPSLSPRSAHPNVRFTCVPHEPLVIENFPFDKYELEPNPLTQFILARKMVGVCWQVFLPNSSKTGALGSTFGYLKASTNLTGVNLFVMPYNYPVLLPLLQEVIQNRLKPSSEWRSQFALYLSSIPPYYMGPLKRALLRIGAGAIAQTVPEENYLSYSVLNYLKKLKYQAKMEYEKTCTEIGIRVQAKDVPQSKLLQLQNPLDTPREELLETLSKLKAQFFRRPNTFAEDKESLHIQPIQQMGNYQEYLKRLPSPLREIESTPLRQHMFGNPFKIDKRIMIDKIDEADLEPSPLDPAEILPHLKLKRKPGPLPSNYHFIPMKNRPSGSAPWGEAEQQMFMEPPPSLVTPIGRSLADFETDSSYLDDDDLEDDEMVLDLDPPTAVEGSSGEQDSTSDQSLPETEEVNETTDENDDDDTEDEEVLDQEDDPENETEEEQPETEVSSEDEEEEDKPETPPVMDAATIFRKNVELRDHLFREIKRPIVRMDLLHAHLNALVGSGDTKLQMVKILQKEALRFKRKRLAKVFEEQADKLLSEIENGG